MNSKDLIESSDVIVIKIGTALVADQNAAHLNLEWLEALAADLKSLHDMGKKIVIVSSGAVAMGRNALKIPLNAPPSSIPLEKKQAASAVGQYHLFNGYFQALSHHNLLAAQVLLTMSETENRRMHLNARATLLTLLESGIIPIINENDTISTGEIRFGDNDRLAARVGQMIEADALILLSTIDGLYTENPLQNPMAEHIARVEKIDESHIKMAGDAIAGLSTGGMKSKIEAAQLATLSGVHMIIADGRPNGALQSVLNDKNTRTTLFLAQNTHKNARKRWIQAHIQPKGTVFIDRGAVSALQSGKSLLPVGVIRVEGVFERGDIVVIRDMNEQKIATGISSYGSDKAALIAGCSSEKITDILGYLAQPELVHRNDLVMTNA